MKTLFKFRGKLVPVDVGTDGGLEFCLLYSNKQKQFFFINSQSRERCWKAKNQHIDLGAGEMPEWEYDTFHFPFHTLPKLFKLQAVRRVIEREYRGFQMI